MSDEGRGSEAEGEGRVSRVENSDRVRVQSCCPVKRKQVSGFRLHPDARHSTPDTRYPKGVTILAEKFIAPGFACAVRWYLEHMFAFAPAGAYVGQWLQSFREFPPRQKPGSFNLDRVMEAVTKPQGSSK